MVKLIRKMTKNLKSIRGKSRNQRVIQASSKLPLKTMKKSNLATQRAVTKSLMMN